MRAKAVVGLVVLALLAATPLVAGVVAQTGFNDAKGINPSDYTSGVGLYAKGAGEPGWTSTWTAAAAAQPYYNTQTSPKTEGDLSVEITNTLGATVLAQREYTDQTGTFYVDAMVRSASSLTGDGFILYTGPNSVTFGDGTATMIQLHGTGSIRTHDGIGDGSLHYEDTGFTWTPGQWVRFSQEVNVPANTYRVWVDGKPYASPDPLGFRRTSSFVDDVQLYLANQGSGRSVNVDQVRVLTHNPLFSSIATGFDSTQGYPDGATVVGKASGEPNWTSPWELIRSGGTVVAQSAVKVSGDQALRMQAPKGDLMIAREYEAKSQRFFLEFDVRIGDSPNDELDPNKSFYAYAGANSPALSGDPGTGFMVGFLPGGGIYACDGNGAGAYATELAGQWVGGEWTHVKALIDVATNTSDLWLDGVHYNAPDPLGFRRNSTFVDDIQFLLQVQRDSNVPVYVDNVSIYVPEPTTLAVFALGLAAAARRRRTRA